MKCKISLKKMEVGSLELEKDLKRWVSGAKMWPEKGGLEGSTSRTNFQCEVGLGLV